MPPLHVVVASAIDSSDFFQCKLRFPLRFSQFVTQPSPHGVVNGADSVTDIVLKAMSRTPDPRLREIMASLVKHLHAFVREARPSEEEFEQGLDFLLRVGKASGAEKNEMILLSDLLGAIHDDTAPELSIQIELMPDWASARPTRAQASPRCQAP